ncbi:RnfABCDGE type electron transport complex subunit G, partial [Candidatus Bipolaricaulota bacterium]|nr:RnfABCDGE type electron transport complex subunit G [Candidatus Bipolaricaulota bacterium]
PSRRTSRAKRGVSEMAKGQGGAYPILFLTLVVLVSIVALTLIDGITRERIAQAQNDDVQEMLTTLFPEMDNYEFDEASGVYTILAGGPIGSALMTKATGYGGRIDILIGVEPDQRLRGIRVISQQETPGLGAKIVEASFLDQFVGLSLDQLALTKTGGSVDAITGATISSSAVIEGVRRGILQLNTEGGG